MDTGLVFYTENVLRVPQFYEAEAAPAVNIPVVGAVGGSASSGLLTFSRTDWDAQKSGYTLDINISGSYASSAASSKDKLKALNNYKAAVQTDQNSQKVEQAAAENIMLKQALADNDKPTFLFDETEEQQYQELTDQIAKNNELMERLGPSKGTNNAKDMRMGMTKSKSLSVNANIMLSLEFVYSPVQQEYVMCYYGVTLGGTFTFNKTFYTCNLLRAMLL